MVRRVFVTITAVVLTVFTITSSAWAARGVVVFTVNFCDYFVVASGDGSYAVLEWYGGAISLKGDVVVGNYETYGFQNIYNLTQDEEMEVWVEDYWLGRKQAIEKVYENCY